MKAVPSLTNDPHSSAQHALRSLPSVRQLLDDLKETELPRPVVLSVVRRELDALRADVLSLRATNIDPSTARQRVTSALDDLKASQIRPVINATGIIIHTNLGRSPLGECAQRMLKQVAANYSTLEYDLKTGERGCRAAYLEHNLAVLCQAEAATVVNNCAAALVLALRHFAGKPPRNRVVISRGELIQIGGGFRIPEILESSGAALHEVGTTNQTTMDDYRGAFDERTAMVLKVHHANFYMGGFVARPDRRELARVAHEAGIPLIEDLGGGATFDTTQLGGEEREPTPAEALDAGVDLVCFSGDKLLGGPQAGILAGRAKTITALKKDPFFRALRCDKLVLASLQATVDATLSSDCADVPVRSMMFMDTTELHTRAVRIVDLLRRSGVDAQIGESVAQVGGGALPKTEIASVSIDLIHARPQRLAATLRKHSTPVIGTVANSRVRLDLRTVFPRQDDDLVVAILASVSA